jgi:shikimate dehydrogenase
MLVGGTTRVGLIIGHPIAQVKSPGLFNRHFAERGEDRVLVPADIAPERVGDILAALRGWHNADGAVVTVPHKRAVVPHLDALTDRARRLRAANVIRRDAEGRLTGENVDGLGFAAAAAAHGFAPAGRAALVVGAGGVGSAIADALCEGGIARLALADLSAEAVAWLARSLAEAFPRVAVETPAAVSDLAGFDLVCNATPVGMGGAAELPLPAAVIDTLRPATLVADVVTDPAMTPFLLRARARGCRVQAGGEMAAAREGHAGTPGNSVAEPA